MNAVQSELKGTVFEAGCSNWYINQHGRNAASWPGYASSYWKEALIPQSGIFREHTHSRMWLANTLLRWIRTTSKGTYGLMAIVFAGLLLNGKHGLMHYFRRGFQTVFSSS